MLAGYEEESAKHLSIWGKQPIFPLSYILVNDQMSENVFRSTTLRKQLTGEYKRWYYLSLNVPWNMSLLEKALSIPWHVYL